MRLGKEVFIEIFENYHRRVYNYIYYRISNSYDAEDLTNQVFEKVISRYQTYQPSKGHFEGWLFGIAKNCANDYLREKKKWGWIPFDFESRVGLNSSQKTPEEEVVIEESSCQLIKLVNKLSQREKNIIALKYGAQLANVEIAKLMNISETNVGSIVYRIIKKLRKEIEKEDVLCLKRV
ncbi:hypothetical protein TZ02_14225 [Clostridium aceticum]|nr:hypothetical protein TZ02_14225 [Clostridium aceticum]